MDVGSHKSDDANRPGATHERRHERRGSSFVPRRGSAAQADAQQDDGRRGEQHTRLASTPSVTGWWIMWIGKVIDLHYDMTQTLHGTAIYAAPLTPKTTSM